MTRQQLVNRIKKKYGTVRHACEVKNQKEPKVRNILRKIDYNKKKHLLQPDIQWLINEFEI